MLRQDTGKRPRSCLVAGLFACTPQQPLLTAKLEEGHLLAAELIRNYFDLSAQAIFPSSSQKDRGEKDKVVALL